MRTRRSGESEGGAGVVVHVSQETPEETDARLRHVLATASLELDERSWWYEELALVEFQRRVRDDAVAIVRDADRWSQLIPVGPADAPPERFRLWTFHFPVDLDNSGFVGWLATHIKRATGSGVFVVCGQNSGRIYDHWGCPESVADRVLETVRGLAARGEDIGVRTGQRGSLHGLRLRVVSSAEAGDVDTATTFAFEQAGPMTWARYEGGKVRLGFLLGALSGSRLECRYVQMANDGRIDGGHSSCIVGVTPDGRVRLTERFQWDTRRGSGTNVFEETPGPGHQLEVHGQQSSGPRGVAE